MAPAQSKHTDEGSNKRRKSTNPPAAENSNKRSNSTQKSPPSTIKRSKQTVQETAPRELDSNLQNAIVPRAPTQSKPAANEQEGRNNASVTATIPARTPKPSWRTFHQKYQQVMAAADPTSDLPIVVILRLLEFSKPDMRRLLISLGPAELRPGCHEWKIKHLALTIHSGLCKKYEDNVNGWLEEIAAMADRAVPSSLAAAFKGRDHEKIDPRHFSCLHRSP